MERSYLIRYGLMGEVGRFAAEAGSGYGRGQTVVIRSHRGTELGEVLIETPAGAPAVVPPAGTARVVRAAGAEDLDKARAAERERDERFAACQRVFRDGVWPIELVDVEPLLDDRRTVLHYLGAHRLDVAGILAAFRAACDLDVMLQPVGRDVPDEETPAEPGHDPDHDHAEGHGCGDCGTGGAAAGAAAVAGPRRPAPAPTAASRSSCRPAGSRPAGSGSHGIGRGAEASGVVPRA